MTLRGTRRRLRAIVGDIGLERAVLELDGVCRAELEVLISRRPPARDLVARAHVALHDALVDARLVRARSGRWVALPFRSWLVRAPTVTWRVPRGDA